MINLILSSLILSVVYVARRPPRPAVGGRPESGGRWWPGHGRPGVGGRAEGRARVTLVVCSGGARGPRDALPRRY